jgi:hypothetical protein
VIKGLGFESLGRGSPWPLVMVYRALKGAKMQPNNSTQRSDRAHGPRGPRPEWREVHRIEHEGIVVAVEMLHSLRPSYTIRVGFQRDGHVVSYIPVQVSGDFHVKVAPVNEAIAAATAKAREWIASDAAQRVSSDIERRIERETKEANRGRPQTRETGKTARKKERLARKAGAA